MQIGVVWFSYGPDGDLLLESMRSVRRTLEAAGHEHIFYVFDDGFMPLSDDVRDKVENEYHAMYVKQFHPRNTNLLGPEHLKEQTKAMALAGRFADVILKIDCDTLLLKCDWIEELMKEHSYNPLMVGSYKGLKNYPMGNCYAVKTEDRLLDRLAKDCETFPAWANSFEDYEVGTRLHRLAEGNDDYAIRYRSGVEDGFWLCDPQQVSSAAKNARVVSCGFGFTACPANKKAEYKAMQKMVMQRLNDDVEGLLPQSAEAGAKVEAVEENKKEEA